MQRAWVRIWTLVTASHTMRTLYTGCLLYIYIYIYISPSWRGLNYSYCIPRRELRPSTPLEGEAPVLDILPLHTRNSTLTPSNCYSQASFLGQIDLFKKIIFDRTLYKILTFWKLMFQQESCCCVQNLLYIPHFSLVSVFSRICFFRLSLILHPYPILLGPIIRGQWINNSTRRYKVPHKCIQVNEKGFRGSTYTKTGKVLTTAASLL